MHTIGTLVAGADEVGGRRLVAQRTIAVAAAWGFSQQAFHPRQALRIGGGVGHFVATAVRHPHGGALHRQPFVERGDPGHGVFTAQLEVHAQVGDQGRGAHIHGALATMARIQQRGTQLLRGNLHHMKAGAQRDAHHLKRARVVAGGFGQIECFDTPFAGQQRDHARLHRVFVFINHLGQRTRHIAARLFAVDRVAVVMPHLVEPRNDVGIGARLQGADLAGGRCAGLQTLYPQGGLDIAQGDWQQGGRIVGRRAFSKTLDDAKRGRRKFGERRHAARGHLEREVVGVAQRAARGVFEVVR